MDLGASSEQTDPGGSGRRPRFRPVDLITLAYVAASVVILLIGGARIPQQSTELLWHGLLLLALGGIGWLPQPRHPLLRFLRDAYPLLLLGWFYRETAILSRAWGDRYHDAMILDWDHALFGGHPHVWLHRAFPAAWLSEVLHGCYLLYILMVPGLTLTLYFGRRLQAFRVTATTIVFTFLVCYLGFVLLPVKGPWYTFAHPEVGSFGIFPPLVWGMLERGAAVGAAFPSSHVAASTAVALMARRVRSRLVWVMTPLAAGIFFATVYGGFHYGVDAVAGLVAGLVLGTLGPRVHAALGGSEGTDAV